MKRIVKRSLLVILTVCFVLAMAGCGKAAEDSTEKTEGVKTESYDAVVDININPSFRVYLDKAEMILAVDQLNNDAKAVCENLTLQGKTFDVGFSEIMEESISQGFVTDDKLISVMVVEAGEDVYAPDIVQNTPDILKDILSDHNIAAKTVVAIASSVVEAQKEKWNSADREQYINEPGEESQAGEKEDCSTCNGSGTLVCWICNGEKELECAECDGKGKFTVTCDECGGTGGLVCDECGGSAYIVCDLCNGQGQQGTCRYCKGTGKCVSCGGSGTEVAETGDVAPCHTCGGSGLHTNLFHGVTKPCNGKDVCNRCDATGQMRCRKCNSEDEGEASGRIRCEACEGTGSKAENCPACNDGIAVCGNCKGTGELSCEECNGSGR